MRHRVFRAEQKRAEDRGVACVDVSVIAAKVVVAVRQIKRGQPIPRHPRVHVMHGVEVVVQKQQGQRPPAFDDHGARPCCIMGAVFQIGADLQQAPPKIGRYKIGPDRHCADQRQPDQNQRRPERMQHPRQNDPAVAPRGELYIQCQHRPKRGCRADQHPPCQRVVEPQRGFCGCRQPRPDGRIKIVRLGVIIGVGQGGVEMVLQMQIPEAQVGDKDSQAGEDQRLGQAPGPERVAVQNLMRKRGILRDGQGGEKGRQNRGQGPELGGRNGPKRISCGEYDEGRPFDCPGDGVGDGAGGYLHTALLLLVFRTVALGVPV